MCTSGLEAGDASLPSKASVGGMWIDARGHKEHCDHPGAGLVTGYIGEYDFKLPNDVLLQINSSQIHQTEPNSVFVPSSGLS